MKEKIHQTVLELLLDKAQLSGSQECNKDNEDIFMEDALTKTTRHFSNFEENVTKIASHLYKQGLRKGDIVIFTTSYQVDSILLMNGVWRANGVVRSMYSEETEDVVVQKVLESEARWLFCDYEMALWYHDAFKTGGVPWPVQIVVCGVNKNHLDLNNNHEFHYFKDFFQGNLEDGQSCPELEITGEDLALILPTSGTTGASKGAMYNHKTLVYTILRVMQIPFAAEGKVNLLVTRCTHATGILLPIALFARGLKVVVLRQATKEAVLQAVDQYKPGFLAAFISYALALCSPEADGIDTSTVGVVLTGGAIVTKPMQKKMYSSLPKLKSFVVWFGMTEGNAIAYTSDFKDPLRLNYSDLPYGSTGKPFPGTLVQVRDPETLELLSEPYQRGELCFQGDFVMQGYFKDPKKTKEAFTPDGWFRTGDIVYLDEDGFIFVVDRAKSVFKYQTNHISPTSLEAVVATHPEVNEACVVPIPDPQEEGEIPRAFVTLKNPTIWKGKESLLAEEIKGFTDTKVPGYQQLRGGLCIVEDLVKGKTGKVDRNLMKTMPLISTSCALHK